MPDLLFFAFGIGTSFSSSGATVLSRQFRAVVLIHMVVSFFYNALVVAVAIQILQKLAAV